MRYRYDIPVQMEPSGAKLGPSFGSFAFGSFAFASFAFGSFAFGSFAFGSFALEPGTKMRPRWSPAGPRRPYAGKRASLSSVLLVFEGRA